MDAFVQLAPIGTSRRIVALGEGTVPGLALLSPLTCGLGAPGRLSAPASAAGCAPAADPARAVDFVPRDMMARADFEEPIWDIYGGVRARSDIASGTLDPAAKAQDAAARSLLHGVDADGERRESAAYTLYRQHRDARIAAREGLASQRLTAEAATASVERQRWAEMREPALRAALDETEGAWREVGRKDQIEGAVAALRRSAANDPQGRWAEWRGAVDPALDLLVDASGGRFAPAAFTLRDLDADDAWLRFEMTGAEMAALVEWAPPERRVLRNGRGVEVERVTFDQRSVAVVRPWFQPEALTSSLWRRRAARASGSCRTEPTRQPGAAPPPCPLSSSCDVCG